MPGSERVSVIIPAYNESGSIYETVRALSRIEWVDEVIVVDDASSDDTAKLAERAGAQVYRLPRNVGKGGALNYGVEHSTGEVVALLDADLGQTASEAVHLIRPVLEGLADMTVAHFPRARRKGGFGLVKGLARWGIYLFTGLRVKSPLSGQRVMTREVLEKLLPFSSGYGVEVALTIKAARLGYRILEVPVQMSHAETGRDFKGFLHRGRQFLHVARVLLQLGVSGFLPVPAAKKR